MEGLCVAFENGLFNRFVLHSKHEERKIDGSILGKSDDKIHVLLFDGIDNFSENQVYDVHFQINRIPYQVQHKALDFVQHHKLFEVLINNPKYSLADDGMNVPEKCETDEVPNAGKSEANPYSEDLNEEQIQAIEQIIQGHYYPLPYLLYGPAGTGKSKTLVAAIKKIVETTEKNVLVCAHSNAACDEIAIRLSESLDQMQMFRMYAKSQRPDKVHAPMRSISNIYDGFIDYPPLKHLYKYRVVICTLATAGLLTRAQCDPNHFSYVIIDECASTTETMALVPIAGLCTSENKVNANIVLAGDPKQLDAVTKSEWANKLGLSISWLEQLFNFPLYKRNASTGDFNSKYITQLVKNYRSHPAILHISNKLFYDGKLDARAEPKTINIDSQLNPNFPIIFKSIQGTCEKDDNDTR